MNAIATARDVLDFWFDGERERTEWFRKDDAFDRAIRERFGATIEAALGDALADWDATAPGALARIVVLDQFTRNAWRGTARAFGGDAQGLAAARALVARGADLLLQPVQRTFAYLPFEHAEDLDAQRESIRLFERLAREHPAFAGAVEWARKHLVIVERFGRFPHRNAALGRASSDEEIEFLRQPGSSF